MKNIYFSSTLMWNASLPEIFRAARAFGAEGIELWAQQFESRGYGADECLELLGRCPLRLFVHSKSWDLNFASLNPRIRAASLGEIKRSIDLAARLRAAEVTVHPPRESFRGDRPYFQQLAYEGLREILRYGRDSGVAVSLEIMEKIPKELMTTRASVQELTRGLFREFSYTVDTAHCSGEAELLDFLRNLPGISKLHISNRRGEKYHTALPDGDFSFQKLWPLLESRNLPMVVEGFDSTNQYGMLQENMNCIQKLKECMK
ncbi:Sugar phosphate isomerase/epimerase [Ruminococcaceae bacterium BL-6]|nr:Sugar phosphate isomerase/epimerase [Ruminococcaceae bacterium BL-6]